MANPSDGVPSKKLKLSPVPREDLKKLSRDELIERVLQQQQELESLQTKMHDSALDVLMQTVEKLKQQVTDSAQQESKLVIRLSTKEHEVQELMTQIQEMKQSQTPSSSQLASMLLDPAINLMFYHMKQEMDLLKGKLEQAQNDLAAWKFTPDSQTGKRLMAKCRMLLQENEELGKNVSTGRVAKLEADIALQKTLITEMKKSEAATEDFLAEMDEDMEAMQSTVYLMQQELKDARERLKKYESAAPSAAIATVPFVDSLNDKNSSLEDGAHAEDQRTRIELMCNTVNQDNSISEIGNSSSTTFSVAAASNTTDSLYMPDLAGLQTSKKTEVERVVPDDGDMPETNCSKHTEFTNKPGDSVKIHNSSTRTSSVELSTAIENQSSEGETELRSDSADTAYSVDAHCHALTQRTAA